MELYVTVYMYTTCLIWRYIHKLRVIRNRNDNYNAAATKCKTVKEWCANVSWMKCDCNPTIHQLLAISELISHREQHGTSITMLLYVLVHTYLSISFITFLVLNFTSAPCYKMLHSSEFWEIYLMLFRTINIVFQFNSINTGSTQQSILW